MTEDGEFDEVYNGPGDIVWDLVKYRKRPKNGQYQVSIPRLDELNETIAYDNRIICLSGR